MFVRWVSRAAMGALAMVSLNFAAAAQSPPPTDKPQVEAFGQLPAVSDPQISPDGKYFATIQSVRGQPAVFIYQIDAPVNAPKTPAIYQEAEWTISGISWAKNDRLIVFVKKSETSPNDQQAYTMDRAVVIDPDVSHVRRLAVDFLLDANVTDPDNVIGANFTFIREPGKDWESYLNVVKADVRTRKTTVLFKGTKETIDWIVDGGNVIGRIDQTEYPRRQHLFLRDGDNWKEVLTVAVTVDQGLGIHGLTEDSKGIVLTGLDKRGMKVLLRYDIATGKSAELFAAPTNHDAEYALSDPWSGRITGAMYVDDTPHQIYFNPQRAALQRGLEQAFPGMQVGVTSSNLAGDKLIVAVTNPKTPVTYYYLNRTTHQASVLVSEYGGLTSSDLGEMKPYPYKARDGMDIPAYLTLPPGKSPANLPMIVMPHGGPAGRDHLDFDWWAQFLANRGYAVLQPNFRGSTGYGKAFQDAGNGEWGLKMQDDITDGVKKLIADGIADPKRICIVGWSYGGYAALAGATFTPDLYACAVAGAGVSDIPYLMGTKVHRSGGKNSQVFDILTATIGDVFKDDTRMKAISPRYHADQVRCPVLLMHGEGDSTVDIGQSEMEEKALLKAGKKVEFIRFGDGEDHHMKYAATRIRMLKELERFLKENIGN